LVGMTVSGGLGPEPVTVVGPETVPSVVVGTVTVGFGGPGQECRWGG